MGDAFAIIHRHEIERHIDPALRAGSRVARRADQPHPGDVFAFDGIGNIDGGSPCQEEQFRFEPKNTGLFSHSDLGRVQCLERRGPGASALRPDPRVGGGRYRGNAFCFLLRNIGKSIL